MYPGPSRQFADPVGDKLAVRRVTGVPAIFGQQPRLAPAQAGSYVDAWRIALGAKSDLSTVGGKRRAVVVSGVGGQADRLATGDMANPNVQVALTGAVGSVGQQFAVSGECRVGGEAGV